MAMTLNTENNQSQNDNHNIQNGEVAISNNISTTLEQVTTLINFEELREESAMQDIKENLSSIMGCIKNIKNELAKNHIQSNDIDYAERMAEVLEYEDFYGNILEDIKGYRR
jgi:hypothetical protein